MVTVQTSYFRAIQSLEKEELFIKINSDQHINPRKKTEEVNLYKSLPTHFLLILKIIDKVVLMLLKPLYKYRQEVFLEKILHPEFYLSKRRGLF